MYQLEWKRGLSVPLAKTLSGYIEKYMQLDPAKYQESLIQLENLRNEVCVALNGRPCQETLNRMALYLGQLEKLSIRFPFGGDKGIKFNFSWFNFYDNNRGKPVSSFEIAFEHASVLYNIGLTYAQMGTGESFAAPEGVKKACNYFQTAAGIFEHLQSKHAPNPLLPQGTDITFPIFQFLQSLMLAQAQECFVMKANMEKTIRHTTMAKLAMATATFYDVARSQAASLPKSVFPNTLPNYLEAKKHYYEAMAHFKKSTEFLEDKLYGKEIFMLQEASTMIKAAPKGFDASGATFLSAPNQFSTSIQNLSADIDKELQRALRDNQLIYQDIVPNRGGNWADCGSAPVVKPFSFPDASIVESFNGRFLLEALPNHQLAAIANQIRAVVPGFLEPFGKQMSDALQQLDLVFLRLELPGVVEGLAAPYGVPREIIQKSEELKIEGGLEATHAQLACIERLRLAVIATIEHATQSLQNEQSEDERERQRFGSVWARAASAGLTAALRKRIDELNDALRKAKESDNRIELYLDPFIPQILSLCGDHAELEVIFSASLNAPSPSRIKLDVGLLEELQLAKGKKEDFVNRSKVMMDFIYATYNSIDIVEKIEAYQQRTPAGMTTMQNNASSTGQAVLDEIHAALNHHEIEVSSFVTEAAEYGRFLDRLMADFNMQRHLFASSTAAREKMIQELFAAYGAFSTVKAQIDSARKFYTEAQAHATGLLNSCRDFEQGRHQECLSLVDSLQPRQMLANAYAPAPMHPSSSGSFFPIPVASSGQSPHGSYQPHPQQPQQLAPQYQQQQQPSWDSQPHPGPWNPSIPIQYSIFPGTAYQMGESSMPKGAPSVPPPNVSPASNRSLTTSPPALQHRRDAPVVPAAPNFPASFLNAYPNLTRQDESGSDKESKKKGSSFFNLKSLFKR